MVVKNKIKTLVDRLDTLDSTDIIITLKFTSNTEYFYIFKVFKNNKLIKEITAQKDCNFKDLVRNLKLKFSARLSTDFSNLTIAQLEYLAG